MAARADFTPGEGRLGARRPPRGGATRLAVTLPAMRVRVDVDACTGHGRCYSLAPDVFGADDAGHCLLLVEEVPPGLEDQARSGERNCPEQAITIEE